MLSKWEIGNVSTTTSSAALPPRPSATPWARLPSSTPSPEILDEYGGLLRELLAPSSDTFSGGNLPGQITDDTSQMFAMAEAIIEANGELTENAWVHRLLHWSQTSPMARMMGPTTRPLLEAIAKGEDTSAIGRVGTSTRKLTSFGTTNGAAMRIAPAGLVYPGDLEGAVRLAWLTSRPTHDTQIAASGAGPSPPAWPKPSRSARMSSPSPRPAWGARRGEEIGATEGRVAGPSVTRRIEIAIDEALRARGLEDALRRIEASVGNSVMTVESVPAAVGIFVAAGGDPWKPSSAAPTSATTPTPSPPWPAPSPAPCAASPPSPPTSSPPSNPSTARTSKDWPTG